MGKGYVRERVGSNAREEGKEANGVMWIVCAMRREGKGRVEEWMEGPRGREGVGIR